MMQQPRDLDGIVDTFRIILQTEPSLTHVMFLYPAAAWSLMIARRKEGDWVLPVSLFGCLLAVYKVVKERRTRSPDLGVFAFALTLVVSIAERLRRHSSDALPPITLILVALSYALPLVYWSRLLRVFPKKRSAFWRSTFHTYCSVSTAFWLVGAYMEVTRRRKARGRYYDDAWRGA